MRLRRYSSMDWAFSLIPEISLSTANKFYTFGWVASLVGAAITLTGVIFLMWGTRVRDHEFESSMTELNSEASAARERAGKLEERAAGLELEAARLRLELDREVQKRAPRTFLGEKKDAFVAAIRGRVPVITVLIERDPEARSFAMAIEIALSEAGIPIHEVTPQANATFPQVLADRVVPFPPTLAVLLCAPGFTGVPA